MMSETGVWGEAASQDATIALIATNVTAAMIIATALALIAAALIIAFIARRPGGYWMMAGVVSFAGLLGLTLTLRGDTFLLLGSGVQVTVLWNAIGYVPALLYSIGLFRLAWSLRSPDNTVAR